MAPCCETARKIRGLTQRTAQGRRRDQNTDSGNTWSRQGLRGDLVTYTLLTLMILSQAAVL